MKDIYGGPIFFELDRAGDVLRFWASRSLMPPSSPLRVPGIQIAPPLPFIPENRHGEPFVAIVACWAGPLDDGERAVQPFRDVAPHRRRARRPHALSGAQQVRSTASCHRVCSTTGRPNSTRS